MQQKRRPHNKSRKGCRNCKRRHVKCDEEGPPCGGCFVRGLQDCIYGPSPSQDASSAESSAKDFGTTPELTHRIELELMHRWTASTHLSMCTVPEDALWLKESLPKWALKHRFLLDGIFSLVALDVALCGGAVTVEDDPRVYYKHALEYYDRASRAYRAEVSKVTQDNIKSLFSFASLAALVNMAIPQCESLVGSDEPQDIIGRMVALFSLLRKAASIAADNFHMLLADPEAAMAIKAGTDALDKPPEAPLPSSIEDALTRAMAVVEKGVRLSMEEEDCEDQSIDEEAAETKIQSHRITILALRMCFVEDAKAMIRGLSIAFPSLAAPDFANELDRAEPLAMFLMLQWGVLLHHLGKTTWWAKGVGKKMVLEIADSLTQSQSGTRLGDLPEWREGIQWAKDEVEKDENDAMVES